MKIKHLAGCCFAMLAASFFQGCVMENLEECPNEYYLKIVYDRNLFDIDAFAAQVKSIDVKVFDSATGREIYQFAEAGDALKADGYRVSLPIPPGNYDILCWGSMAEGDSFGYADPSADILEHHNVVLQSERGVSSAPLNNLFHGLLKNFTFADNNTIGSMAPQTAFMELTKNTNRVNITLQNINGRQFEDTDFRFEISSQNGEMDHDNSLRARREMKYLPGAVTPVYDRVSDERDTWIQSTVTAEFHMGRLCDESESRLDVYRNSDGKRIISVPLERNLLQYKEQYYTSMNDDEYLNRRDNYSITFILDKNDDWDVSARILIEDWATLPIQYQEW